MTKIVTFLPEILKYRIDLYCGEPLAMSFCAFVVFAAFELENDDFRAATILEHGRGDPRSGDCGRANANAARVSGNQNLVEFHTVSFILIGQNGNVNDVSGTYTKLFSTCAYNCVRHFMSPPISLHLESRRL
jgi:hypothetical protein